MKIFKIIIILFCFINIFNINSIIVKRGDFSKGPLKGKNLYIPYSIYYNITGLSASSGNKFEFEYKVSTYYLNDFFLTYVEKEKTEGAKLIKYTDSIRVRDYESFVFEIDFSLYIMKNFQVGLDLRFHSYYPGFLDAVIENFHYAFNFPNAGREQVSQNELFVNIKNNNGVILYLDRARASFGDIDIWAKYTFFEKKFISLAVLGALKIPTGRLGGCYVSGSGYPDFGFALLADIRPFWLFSFYLQAGIVIPLDSIIPAIPSNPYPMFNGLVGISINPAKIFSFLIQFNIKTSPLDDFYGIDSRYNLKYLNLPQVNLLVGFLFQYKNYKWQFYFEEDAFTNQGTDLTINISYSHKIRIKTR